MLFRSFQDIGIQVYSKNAIPVSLVIDDCAYQLEDQIDQIKRYNFKELGEYTIYAEGRADDGTFIRSNIVKIDVDMIPTFLFLVSKDKALLEENVKITGILLDYFNDPISAELTVNTGDSETVLMTDEEGYFQLYGTRSSEGYLNVSAFYPGNSTYNNSNANISIFFSRSPVKLDIQANKLYINTNETVDFIGSVDSIKDNYSVPIVIIANSSSVKTIIVRKDFNFSLDFSDPGEYEVYASFQGDCLFKPANSNIVIIEVQEEIDILSYAAIILLVIILSIVYMYAPDLREKIYELHRKETNETNKTNETTGKDEIKIIKEEPKKSLDAEFFENLGIEKAYKMLFDDVINEKGLKRSLTPKELLKIIKNMRDPFADLLEDITDLYERAVYCSVEPTAEEKENYFGMISKILGP